MSSQTTGSADDAETAAFVKQLTSYKVVTIALGLVGVSIVLFVLNHFHGVEFVPASSRRWWNELPYEAVASTLLSTAVIALVYEWFVRRESAKSLQLALKAEVNRLPAELRNSVVDALMLGDRVDELAIPDARIADLMSAALRKRGLPADLSVVVVDFLDARVIGQEEIWYGLKVTVNLAPLDPSVEALLRHEYLEGTFRFQYETTKDLRGLTFAVAASKPDYDARMERLRQGDFDVVWQLKGSDAKAPGRARQLFDVTSASIDGLPLSVAYDRSSRTFACDPSGLLQPRTRRRVDYTFRACLRWEGRQLMLEVPRPCLNANYSINFESCRFGHTRIVEMFSATSQPAPQFVPNEQHARAASFDVAGWILPRSGLVLVWSPPSPLP